MKVISHSKCEGCSFECKHLENEFKMLKKASHPNIIKLTHSSLIKNLSDANIEGCCIFLQKGNCDLL